MQLKSEELKKKIISEVFEFEKSLIGGKLLLAERMKMEKFDKNFGITPTNISQILMTHDDKYLPKYRLDIQKHFTKGVIKGLGNCYITIRTYFIKDLYRFDNIFCIKFEIMPFKSKTKFYKFLINSKDIKLYLNLDYPTEHPYQNWQTIHYIIQSLVLKRSFVYNSIELPVTDPKFKLMKYHQYNLVNVASQSMESASIGAKVIFGNFLRSTIQETQVLLQTTKRIGKSYVLITIEKHNILDHWSFIIYDPRTCRKYVTSIYFSDILGLDPTLMDKLYSTEAIDMEAETRAKKSYSDFTKSYSQAARGRKSIKGVPKRSMSRADLNSLILDEKKITKDQKEVKPEENSDNPAQRNFYEVKVCLNNYFMRSKLLIHCSIVLGERSEIYDHFIYQDRQHLTGT